MVCEVAKHIQDFVVIRNARGVSSRTRTSRNGSPGDGFMTTRPRKKIWEVDERTMDKYKREAKEGVLWDGGMVVALWTLRSLVL